jgi:transposase
MTSITLSSRQRSDLEVILTLTPSARQRCRAQALLWLAEGASAVEVAESLHVSRQTIYNWVGRYSDRDGLPLAEWLRDAPRPGRPRTGGGIDPLIAEVIDSDPRGLGYRSTVWTAPLLSRYLHERHRIAVCDRTVSRAIARLGIRWKRPRHQLARRPTTWRQSKGG